MLTKPTPPPARRLLDAFLRHLRVERGLSPRTEQTYAQHLRGYLAFLPARGRDPLSVDHPVILAYLDRRQQHGVGPSTLFGAVIALRQFHRFLTSEGQTPNDPTAGMKLPKLRQRLPKPLSVDQMDRLLMTVGRGKGFHHVRNLAMLELMYSTGIRVSELINIELGQIDLKENWLRVVGKGGRERLVPISARAKGSLLNYMDARTTRFAAPPETMFLNSRGSKLSRGGFWQILRRVAIKAGLKESVFPHRIRHSAATHLLAGGADVRVLQQLLGHASIVTTERYTQVSIDLLKRTCKKAHPRF